MGDAADAQDDPDIIGPGSGTGVGEVGGVSPKNTYKILRWREIPL